MKWKVEDKHYDSTALILNTEVTRLSLLPENVCVITWSQFDLKSLRDKQNYFEEE